MSRRQFATVLVGALVFAFLGGFVAQSLSLGRPAVAQDDDPIHGLKAQSFVLVDAKGATRAVLGLRQGEPSLRMMGTQRGSQLELGIATQGPRLVLQPVGVTAITLGKQGLVGIDSSGIGE